MKLNKGLEMWVLILISFALFIASPKSANSQEIDISPQIIEAVILIDESDSMKGPNGSDPNGLRYIAGSMILEYLSLHNEQNSASVILFGTGTETVSQLSRELPELSQKIQSLTTYREPTCTPQKLSPASCIEFDSTPIGCFTDLYLVLKEAANILEKSPDAITLNGREYRKQKFVFLITDGRHDPWPGHSRLGNLGEEFIRWVSQHRNPCSYLRNRAQHNRWQNQAVSADSENINTLLMKFINKGWKIHTLGVCKDRLQCEEKLDINFLTRLANETAGEMVIAYSPEEIQKNIRKILPPTSQLLTIPLQRRSIMCNGTNFPVNIPPGSRFNKFRMFVNFGRIGGIERNILNLEVISPTGQTFNINDNPDLFRIYSQEIHEGREVVERVRVITFEQNNPQEGTWNVKITARGRAPQECAEVDVFGKRNQVVLISVDCLRIGLCEPGRQTNIHVGLITPQGEPLPFNNANCRIKIGSRWVEIPLTLIQQAGRTGVSTGAQGTFTLPQREGNYKILCGINIEGLPQPISNEVYIKVQEQLIGPIFNEKEIFLGKLSKRGEETQAHEVEIESCENENPGTYLEIKPTPLEGKQTGAVISRDWIRISPRNIRAESGERFSIKARFPENANLSEAPNDIYEGDLIITKRGSDYEESRIHITLDVRIPTIKIKPEPIKFTYRFHPLTDELSKNIMLKTDAIEEISATLKADRDLIAKGKEQSSESFAIKIKEIGEITGNGKATTIKNGKKKLTLLISIPGAHNKEAVKRYIGKTFEGNLLLTSPDAHSPKTKIIVSIPKTRIPKKYLYMIISFIYIVLIIQNLRTKSRYTKKLYELLNTSDLSPEKAIQIDNNAIVFRTTCKEGQNVFNSGNVTNLPASGSYRRFKFNMPLESLLDQNIDDVLKKLNPPDKDDYSQWELTVYSDKKLHIDDTPLNQYKQDTEKAILSNFLRKFFRITVFAVIIFVIIKFILP